MSNWALPAGLARSEPIGLNTGTTTRTTVTTGTNHALGSWTSLGTSTIRAQAVQIMVSTTTNVRSVGWQLGINAAGPYMIAEGVFTLHRGSNAIRDVILPIQIPNGTQIYVKTSHTADTTAHNCLAAVRLFEHNHHGRVPSPRCETIGANLGVSTAEKQTTITGNLSPHVKSAWTSLGTISNAWRGFMIHVTEAAGVSLNDQQYFVDVGIDRAGGTSFTEMTSNLLTVTDVGSDDQYLTSPWIDRDMPSGCSIGLRFQSSGGNRTLYGHAIGAVR